MENTAAVELICTFVSNMQKTNNNCKFQTYAKQLGLYGAVGTDQNRCSMRMRPTTRNFQHIARHFFDAFRRCSNWSNRKALSNSTRPPGKCYQYWLAKYFLKCTATHTDTRVCMLENSVYALHICFCLSISPKEVSHLNDKQLGTPHCKCRWGDLR